MENPLKIKIDIFSYPILSVFLVTTLFINGIAKVDIDDYAYITTHIFNTNPNLNRQFLYGSPFTFFLGWPVTKLFGTNISFHIIHGTGLILFSLSLGKYLHEEFHKKSNNALFVLMTTPLFFILTQWIGKSDAYLLAFLLATYWLHDNRIIFLTSTATVLCHQEIGSILLLFQVTILKRNPAPAIAALIAGNAGVYIFEHFLLSPIPQQNRTAYALEGLRYRVEQFLEHPLPYLTYSLGGLWVYVCCLTRPTIREALIYIAAFVLSVLGADSTRVFCLLSVPLLLSLTHRIVHHPEFITFHNRKIVILLIVSTVIHYQVVIT